MPSVDLAAKRWAQAAFELAVQGRAEQAWSVALSSIAGFTSRQDVRSLLENSRVTGEAKLQLVDAGLADLPPLPLNFARLLVTKGRTGLAPQIAEQFDLLAEERRGVTRARATTAVELSSPERATLAGRLRQITGHEILLEASVEPRILGGLVLQIGDRLIDGSTRSRLRALNESMATATG